MQIQHLSSFLSSTYNSIQDRISSTLNKKYVLITLVVASILALLVAVISIQRKAKLKKMDINAIKNIEEPTPQTELQPNAEVKTKQLEVCLSPLRGSPFSCTMQGSDTIEALKKQIEKNKAFLQPKLNYCLPNKF